MPHDQVSNATGQELLLQPVAEHALEELRPQHQRLHGGRADHRGRILLVHQREPPQHRVPRELRVVSVLDADHLDRSAQQDVDALDRVTSALQDVVASGEVSAARLVVQQILLVLGQVVEQRTQVVFEHLIDRFDDIFLVVVPLLLQQLPCHGSAHAVGPRLALGADRRVLRPREEDDALAQQPAAGDLWFDDSIIPEHLKRALLHDEEVGGVAAALLRHHNTVRQVEDLHCVCK
mmetsp:Transcript_28878/g.72516  ORF Transcript_28878/g.72516 Transcript_28878/m.72516 type:complete len:235 (-) Transcript_28878:391-1095(-)